MERSSTAVASVRWKSSCTVTWDRPSIDGAELRERYLGERCPALTGAGAVGLDLHLDDDQAPIEGPAPCPDSELPYRAVVSLWLAAHDQRRGVEEVLEDLGVRTAGYLVTESVFTRSEPGGSEAHSHAAHPAERRGTGNGAPLAGHFHRRGGAPQSGIRRPDVP